MCSPSLTRVLDKSTGKIICDEVLQDSLEEPREARRGDRSGPVESVIKKEETKEEIPGLHFYNLGLAGRGLPQRDVLARAAENDDIADALTREQSVLLRATDVLPRVELRGGAGSGKTYLAVEQARRRSRRGLRVALICYSHGLAGFLKHVTAGWGADRELT